MLPPYSCSRVFRPSLVHSCAVFSRSRCRLLCCVRFGKTIPGYASPGEEPRAVSLCLKPGDVSVHSSRSVHGSEANRSARQRCGLTISYMPASSQLVAKSRPDFEGGWPCLYLLRGEATPGVNDHDGVSFAPWPTYVEGEHMPFADANPPFVLGTPRL